MTDSKAGNGTGRLLAGVGVLLVQVICGRSMGASAEEAAKEILDTTGVKGGVIVHLGCGDGKVTAALGASGRYTVVGLDADAGNVAKAREVVREAGEYGDVSVEGLSGGKLPYADNLVNLVVGAEGIVPPGEMMRVVAPGGAVCVGEAGKWKVMRKERPSNIDEWTHFLHDASNNAVANDRVVGPPRSIQWAAEPLWLRSHETPSGVEGLVSAAGRLFYFFDEGLIGIVDERLPDRWSLVCRDAFNGKLLWKKEVAAWGWREWSREKWEGKDWTVLRAGRLDVPNENQRRIVATGDRLYVTLSWRAPMSIVDAATGEIIKTIKETGDTQEILESDGIVVAYVGRGEEAKLLVAVDGGSGKVLWEKKVGAIRPLDWAIDKGRVVYLAGKSLCGAELKSGKDLWKVGVRFATPKTIVNVDDVVVMQGGVQVAAYDAKDGGLLWEKRVPAIGGGEGDDLFVVDGMVWRGMLSVDEEGKAVGKSPNALVIGWDLRTGDEKKRIMVKDLRSPEHHHRCYRNKATVRYMISSYEGAEFLDFEGDDHGQNNWLRGSCGYGMMPCNGLLYVPPDQCFCQPGAKILGFTAVKAGGNVEGDGVSDDERLYRGPAYGKVSYTGAESNEGWRTFRHDAARSGSTKEKVGSDIKVKWKAEPGGKLTAPVAADGKVFAAGSEEHTVYALDAANGEVVWRYTAGGRVDSPPTIYRGLVLFGSKDGYVYCLREADGELVWRFLAAVCDRRIVSFGQAESVWPVHGSVLVDNGAAYFTAGRSTYLDGGIRLYGVDPLTGRIIDKGLLEGPYREAGKDRDLAFFMPGANSDVLVSEGGYIYMRQKKLTRDLKEIVSDDLSVKGEKDVGMHVFSTAGLLDDSWYNRSFWMYSKRWPGFQLANQAPKTGQLLVVDDEKTYAVRVFYRRNVHSPMFFPGKEGYLLFADNNDNEPQIVGEAGAVKPVEWLPQSDYALGRASSIRTLDSEAFGLDKMIGYTRAKEPVWTDWLKVRIRAMVKAGDSLFVAGPPDVYDEKDPFAAFEGRRGAAVVAVSAAEGKKLSEMPLASPPVFDGMIAVEGNLFACLVDGTVVCIGAK